MIKKLILVFLCLDVLFLSGIYLEQIRLRNYLAGADERMVTLDLHRGPFTVREFSSKRPVPRAVITFNSGDGGWGGWEETVCHALQDHGYMVIGIDSAIYAQTDYDLAILQGDFGNIVRSVYASYPSSPPPLIVGGWSMGAAQSLAVAGGPNPPPHLVGTLLASMLSRGRYGLRFEDRLNILPRGPGTFGVADFAGGLKNLRVVQWHGQLDTIDSLAWLATLKSPYREYTFPKVGHNYDGPCPQFLEQFVASVAWILGAPTPGDEP
jgi:hypothetical protein